LVIQFAERARECWFEMYRLGGDPRAPWFAFERGLQAQGYALEFMRRRGLFVPGPGDPWRDAPATPSEEGPTT
jgi:hypothetical protein